MKALSLWQPFASLMVAGKKRCETRSWRMLHRGQLLIHAAKKWEPELAGIACGAFFRPALESMGIVFDASEEACKSGWGLPFGAIIGRVDVVDCYPTEKVNFGVPDVVHRGSGMPSDKTLVIGPTEQAFGDFSPGRFAFLCENAVRFEKPIVWRGMQGIFDVSDELVKDVA